MAGPFVDRIEGRIAVLIVDGREEKVPLDKLPKGLREGVYLTADRRAIDRAATDAATAEIEARRKSLKKDDGGDFSL
jgi:hypothetical protein